MAEQHDSMAKEIEEELRRERLLKLWDKYGTYVLAGAVLVVGGVGGMKFYEHRQAQAADAASIQYIVALRDFAIGKPEDAQKSLEKFIPSAPRGYATLARLRLAAHERSAGNAAEALAVYQEVATDGSADALLADFARLQVAAIKVDTGDFTDAKNRLTPLAGDRNPWRYSARELLGVIAYKTGRLPEARNYFQRLLSDATTPPGISERVKVLVAVMTQDEQSGTLPALDLLRSFEKSDLIDGKTK